MGCSSRGRCEGWRAAVWGKPRAGLSPRERNLLSLRNNTRVAKGRAVPAATRAGFATRRSCRAAFSRGGRCTSSRPTLGPRRSPGGHPAFPAVARGQSWHPAPRAAGSRSGGGQPRRGRMPPLSPSPRTGTSRSPRRDTLFPAGEGSGCASGNEPGSKCVIF